MSDLPGGILLAVVAIPSRAVAVGEVAIAEITLISADICAIRYVARLIFRSTRCRAENGLLCHVILRAAGKNLDMLAGMLVRGGNDVWPFVVLLLDQLRVIETVVPLQCAFVRAEQRAVARKERSVEQRHATCVTVEAGVGGVPVLRFVGHLRLVGFDAFTARITVLGVHGLEAAEAERLALSHHIALAAQALLAVRAAEMVHMPTVTFGFGAFITEDDLAEMNNNGRN